MSTESAHLGRPRCLNCKEGLVTRPRGLCWNCYYQPGVKDRFPPIKNYGKRMAPIWERNGVGEPTLMLGPPTLDTFPGTSERIAVYANRFENGYAIFNPHDNLYINPLLD